MCMKHLLATISVHLWIQGAYGGDGEADSQPDRAAAESTEQSAWGRKPVRQTHTHTHATNMHRNSVKTLHLYTQTQTHVCLKRTNPFCSCYLVYDLFLHFFWTNPKPIYRSIPYILPWKLGNTEKYMKYDLPTSIKSLIRIQFSW